VQKRERLARADRPISVVSEPSIAQLGKQIEIDRGVRDGLTDGRARRVKTLAAGASAILKGRNVTSLKKAAALFAKESKNDLRLGHSSDRGEKGHS